MQGINRIIYEECQGDFCDFLSLDSSKLNDLGISNLRSIEFRKNDEKREGLLSLNKR